MSSTSANLQAGLRNQARLERQRTIPVKQTKKSNSKEKLSVGMISQRKLSNVMQGVSKVPQFANGPPVSSSAPNCFGNMPRVNIDDPLLDEAVKAIVELNRENLTEEQLVDLLASFYYVTNRYFRRGNLQPSENAITKSPGKCTEPESRHQSAACTPEATVSLNENNNSQASPSQCVFSLREKKQLQWMKEQEEMSRLGEASQYPASANYKAPPQGTDRYWRTNDLARQDQFPPNGQPVPSSIARTVPTPHMPPNNIPEAPPYPAPAIYRAPSQDADRYWRMNDSARQGPLPPNGQPVPSSIAGKVPTAHMPPNNIQGGFFIGEDPGVLAAQKERQRQEWLTELDRQVQEKKALKEREKTLVLSEDMRAQAPCTPVYLRRIDQMNGGSARYDDRMPRLHAADLPQPPPPPLPQPQPLVNGIHESPPSVMNRTPPETRNPIHQQPQSRELLNQNAPAEHGFSRGRGLANLEERSNEATIKRKQQQLELQAAYDKQIKEREARRKEERERLLQEELAEAERIERERQQMEEEMRAEEKRRREALIAAQEQNRENARLFQQAPSRGKVQSPDVSVAATEKQQMSPADSSIPKLSKRAPAEVAVDERPILTMDRPLPTSHRQVSNDDEPILTVCRRIVGVPQTERSPTRPLDATPAFHPPVTSCAATNCMTKNRPTNGSPRRPVDTQAVSRANANSTYNAHRKGSTDNYRRPSRREVSGVLTPTDFDAAARAEYRQESPSRRGSDQSTPLAIIRTQSNLCPPAADFLSAITNPDYAYEEVCSGLEKCQIGQNASHTRAVLRPSEGLPQRSALEQVSKIKRNLLQRQEELRSMQISASNNNRPH